MPQRVVALTLGLPASAQAVLLLAACGAPPGPSEPSPPPAATVGVLEGLVRLGGSGWPDARSVENTTDPSVCGRVHRIEEVHGSGTNRGIGGVLLAVANPPASREAEPGHLILDNVGCRFSPHASVLTVGSSLEVLNSDPVLHTVHLYGPFEINIALPFRGTRAVRKLDRKGLYSVRCDVHGWMKAYIRVDSHPYQAVSGLDGSFRLPELPAGSYVLEAWHEALGVQKVVTQVGPGQTTRIEVEYPWP